jgi:hypothetical protein
MLLLCHNTTGYSDQFNSCNCATLHKPDSDTCIGHFSTSIKPHLCCASPQNPVATINRSKNCHPNPETVQLSLCFLNSTW